MLAEVHAGEGPLDTTGGGTGQYHIYTYQMEKWKEYGAPFVWFRPSDLPRVCWMAQLEYGKQVHIFVEPSTYYIYTYYIYIFY